ncbi:MAG TPA: hypothetical protein VFV13_14290 [Acidimicrobiia bacterium]|nr:hypothetical protein [Acidimicrobiia bacterium]
MANEVHEITTERERQSDLEFATRAVIYLRTMGLSNDEVADYLVDEFGLDRDAAGSMVSVAA